MNTKACLLIATLSALFAPTLSASSTQVEPRQMPPYGEAPMGAAPPPMVGPGMMPPPGMGGPYPPFPLKDPGFSVTHGFEGFLVPSSWLGGFGALLPWGIEGLVILGGIIVFTVIVALVILCLLSWWPVDWWRDQIAKKDDKDAGSRAMGLSSESVLALTQRVLDAVDKYSELNLVTPTKKE